MRSIVLAAVLALLGSAGHAQTPTAVDVATVSMTPAGVSRLVTNTICATDGRDLVCDGGAYVLPGGLISTTNISTSALTVNGVAITGLGGGAASPTNVPAFLARSTSGQSIPHGTNTKINFNFEEFDTYNNFSSGRFTPTISGKYIFTGTAGIDGNVDIFAMLYKNGSVYAWGNRTGLGGGPNQLNYSTFSIVADANGATDYFEMYVYHTNTGSSASSLIVDGARNYFSGSLLASGNGLISGSTALGDRITSGTASGVVAMAGGTVSFTTGGISGTAYLDTVGRFVGAGVSTTGAISATSIYAGASLQLTSPTAVTTCNSSAAGTIRYNSPTTTLELCTGSGWQPMGVGIPAGTISAFASTTCPTGWSEYTAARGRFLRGIDNGAGNDPDGTRAPGATQADALQDHYHSLETGLNAAASSGNDGLARSSSGVSNGGFATARLSENVTRGFGNLGSVNVNTIRWSTETRPKNVAVTYCQFNGTSNGWNNPLSGGSTTAAGSTGQLQYNTAGAFDASAGLLWDNAGSLLTVTGRISATNISVTALTVNGVDITNGGGASRLASLTDVSLTGASTGQVLMHNGVSWTNANVSLTLTGYEIVGASVGTGFTGWFYASCPAGKKAFGGACGTNSGAVATNGALSTNAYGCYAHTAGNTWSAYASCALATTDGSVSTALGDRITSGTSAVTMNSATGIVSITQLGAVTSYVHPSLGYVGPGVSATGPVSAMSVYAGSSVKLAGSGANCATADDYGRMFRNPTTGRLQLCMPRN